jgi:hypothetical protein
LAQRAELTTTHDGQRDGRLKIGIVYGAIFLSAYSLPRFKTRDAVQIQRSQPGRMANRQTGELR